MTLVWVLYVFLMGTEIEERVYFNDLDSCIEYAHKIREQDLHQRQAGDTLYLKAYCIPKKVKE